MGSLRTAVSRLGVVLAALLALACAPEGASAEKKDFEAHDQVPLVANKVGPFTNPSETYQFFSLPFCKPETLLHEEHNFAQVLAGDRKVRTHYDIRFRVNEDWRQLCENTLSPEEVKAFASAIEEDYFFELFLDGLPIWGFIGDTDDPDPILADATGEARHNALYTHLHFSIAYNGPNVVGVNVSTDPDVREPLDTSTSRPMRVRFSYSVEWHPSETKWEDRMNAYNDHHMLPTPLEVHWLAIVNSLILVVLLTATLAIILLRVVNHDFAAGTEEEEDGAGYDEIGWKLVHGEVFRLPRDLSLFTALVGAGAQLYVTVLLLLLLTVSNLVHVARRGAVLSTILTLYTLTTGVGGFVSARLYRKLRGSDKGHSWAWNILLAIFFFPLVVAGAFVFVNTTAVAHGSTQAVPFGTIMVILVLFFVVAIPLGVVGGVVGRRTRTYKAPARPAARPRKVPDIPLWRSWPVQLFLAGFLPFSAISIELHFIFAAVWGHKVYTLFGILLIAFALLTVVCAFIVVGLVYFQLASEDYRWWWRSFASGGMVGLFIFTYAVFFYHGHTEMSGMLQASFFFTYMGIVSVAFFLMFGSIGFAAAFFFVDYIYTYSKSE